MYFRASISIFKMAVKESLAYRADMLFSIITFPITMLVAFFVWSSIFEASGASTLGGFTLDEMIGYYIISLLVYSLVWNPITDVLHRGVREGEFIKFIVKPISFPFYSFFNTVGHRIVAFFVEAAPVFLIMAFILDISYITTTNLYLFLIALLFAFLTHYLLSLLMGALIFWLTKPTGINYIYRIARYLLAGGLIPLTFFPEVVQRILLFLPFPFINYIPTAIFVGNTSFAGVEFTFTNLILYGTLQLFLISIVVYFVWSKSIKKFQGVGA